MIMPIATALNFSAWLNRGIIFLKMIIPKGINRTTPVIVPGE